KALLVLRRVGRVRAAVLLAFEESTSIQPTIVLDEVSLPHGPRNVPWSVKVVRSRVRSPELRIVCRVHVKRLSSAVCRVALATRMAVY
ncbi:MAG: hypothetical protein ACKN82_03335, partial [Pirellula sp.]